MTVPKKYIHDRIILLILSINAFLTIAGIISIIFSLGGVNSNSYIVQYRANLGLGAFTSGSVVTFYSFVVFMVLIMVLNTFLSIKVFNVRRGLSVAVLGMATLLILLTISVSRSLLINAL